MTDEPRPIMIAGCGRSGTSLLRALLDAHPDIAIPSESLFIVDYLKHAGKLPRRLARWLLYREPQLRCWYDRGPILDEYVSIGEELKAIHRVYARSRNASIWGQKTPRFVRSIDLIERNLGPCNWILVYRDPRAVYASMRASGQHTGSLSLACRRWKRDNIPVLCQMHDSQDTGISVMTVQYETLVEHPEETVDKVCRFCGVPLRPLSQLLSRARPVFFSRSRFSNNTIRGSVMPDPARIESWKKTLSSWQVSYIERECQHEMRRLGYAPSGVFLERRPWLELVAPLVVDIRIVYRYLIYWPEYVFYTLLRKAVMGLFRMLRVKA